MEQIKCHPPSTLQTLWIPASPTLIEIAPLRSIFKQVCNFRRRPHYLIEMFDGNRIICSDRVSACAQARNLSCTYFIEPIIH